MQQLQAFVACCVLLLTASVFASSEQNLHALDAKFWSVSDPNSAEYRQFLSAAELSALVAPSADEVSAVREWLLHNGVAESAISVFGDSMQVKASVAVVERLFRTELYEFHHAEAERLVIRQLGGFSLPKEIGALVDMVLGLSSFPVAVPSPRFQHNEPLIRKKNLLINVTVPQTAYGLYNLPSVGSALGAGPSNTSQAAISFWQGQFLVLNFDLFSEEVGIPISIAADHIFNLPSPPLDAAQSNIEYLAATNPQATNWFYQFQSYSTLDWIYGFTQFFLNATDVPQVMSFSAGWWEGETCRMTSECSELGVNDFGYVARMNIELQKLGLRGVSIIVPTGDSGAHTATDMDCKAKSLRTDFPASSPYVTAVGSTGLANPSPLANPPEICRKLPSEEVCVGGGTEVATSSDVDDVTSGGGFSQVAPMPAYQSAAVQKYLSSGVQLPPASYYNASNRAIPDVSALGAWSPYFALGVGFNHGTTVSTPIFAAIVSRLNAESVAQSGQPLGFLNPLLYQIAAQHPSAFNDITVGDNICTQNGCAASCRGFLASRGWDPVTGLGTPNYPELLAAVKKLRDGRRIAKNPAAGS